MVRAPRARQLKYLFYNLVMPLATRTVPVVLVQPDNQPRRADPSKMLVYRRAQLLGSPQHGATV